MDLAALDPRNLRPLHLLFAAGGQILSAGPTLRKLIGDARTIGEGFIVDRQPGIAAEAAWLARCLSRGDHVSLRLRGCPAILLRGSGIAAGADFLLDLGFGMSLIDAVRAFDLSNADFAASDLALELLFLHEANRAAMEELARTNRRLDEARATAAKLAVTDPLTGLLNRRGFQLELEQAMRSVEAQPFALAQLDLDDFKLVNDRHGHAAGDAVLEAVARILEAETRAADRIGRTGGDEYLLLLLGSAGPATLTDIGKRIVNRIRCPIAYGDVTLEVSASIGFSRSLDHAVGNWAAMMAEADAALYRQKSRRACRRGNVDRSTL